MTDNRLTIAEQQEARRAAKRAANPPPAIATKQKRAKRAARDRIDGYEHLDDIGHSPDY